jgi:hypothetical protein
VNLSIVSLYALYNVEYVFVNIYLNIHCLVLRIQHFFLFYWHIWIRTNILMLFTISICLVVWRIKF